MCVSKVFSEHSDSTGWRLTPVFRSIKGLGILLLPLEGMLVHRRLSPCILLCCPKSLTVPIYTPRWWREALRQRDIMTPTSARSWTTRPRVQHYKTVMENNFDIFNPRTDLRSYIPTTVQGGRGVYAPPPPPTTHVPQIAIIVLLIDSPELKLHH